MDATLRPIARVLLRRPIARVVLSRLPVSDVRRAMGSGGMDFAGAGTALLRLLAVGDGGLSFTGGAHARVLAETFGGSGMGSMLLGDGSLG